MVSRQALRAFLNHRRDVRAFLNHRRDVRAFLHPRAALLAPQASAGGRVVRLLRCPARHHGAVEILLWLLPAVLATCAAMAWVSWIGRERPERERSESEQERFAAALMRPLPAERERARQRERSTGVAVRRTATGHQTGHQTGSDRTRRSA